MKILTTISLIFFSLLTTQTFAERRTGQYFGVERLNKRLNKSLFNDRSNNVIRKILERDRKVEAMLGSYKLVEGEVVFSNYNPNPLNYVLYQFIFLKLSKAIAAQCENETGEIYEIKLSNKAKEILRENCKWPNVSKATSRRLWINFTSFLFNEKDFSNWTKFLKSKLLTTNRRSYMETALMAIFMDPNYLLEQ